MALLWLPPIVNPLLNLSCCCCSNTKSLIVSCGVVGWTVSTQRCRWGLNVPQNTIQQPVVDRVFCSSWSKLHGIPRSVTRRVSRNWQLLFSAWDWRHISRWKHSLNKWHHHLHLYIMFYDYRVSKWSCLHNCFRTENYSDCWNLSKVPHATWHSAKTMLFITVSIIAARSHFVAPRQRILVSFFSLSILGFSSIDFDWLIAFGRCHQVPRSLEPFVTSWLLATLCTFLTSTRKSLKAWHLEFGPPPIFSFNCS